MDFFLLVGFFNLLEIKIIYISKCLYLFKFYCVKSNYFHLFLVNKMIYILLIGDFIIPWYINHSLSGNSSTTVTELVNLSQFVSQFQYDTRQNANDWFLDPILTNFNCSVINAPICFVFMESYHPAIHVQFKATLASLNHKQNTISKFYNFKNIDFVYLYQYIAESDWLVIFKTF